MTSMTFGGVYRYASASELESAVAEVSELLDAEDDDVLASGFDRALRRRGIELRIDLAAECSGDWYLVYESLVELLAARANAGSVDGTLDGVTKTYAGGTVASPRAGTEPLVRHGGSSAP